MKSVNKLHLLPGITLVPIIQKIPPDNSFVAERATCQGKTSHLTVLTSLLSVLSKGVVAVLGPQSKSNSDHIKSICDNTEVPFIETRPALTERHQLSSINLHPDPDKMGDILGKISVTGS